MKSSLFEYYAKKRDTLPVFKTERVGGSDHQPLFQSTVTLSNRTQHLGEASTSKKEAESSAAEVAFLSLSNSNIDKEDRAVVHAYPESPPLHLGRVVCIIDYENLPNMFETAMTFSKVIEQIYVVIGDHHHNSSQEFPGAIKILCPSMAANAVDHCMTMMVGSFLQVNRFDTYVLVSRDKFVSPVCEMITKPTVANSNVVWRLARAEVATKPAHFETLFCT